MTRSRSVFPVLAAFAAVLALSSSSLAEEQPALPAPAPSEGVVAESAEANPGDTRRIDFTPAFTDALAEAKASAKPMFLKPIYGGVDKLGARDYRCGSW